MEFIKNNKKPFIFLLIALILFIISITLSRCSYSSKYDKVIKNGDYVFTQSTKKVKDGIDSNLPYINLDGKEIKKANEDIISLYYSVINSVDGQMYYEYSIKNSFLSLLITVQTNEDGGDFTNTSFIVYNIDMENKKILSNDQFMNLNSVSLDEINTILTNQMEDYYNLEISKGYIDSNICDFDCYLEQRNFVLDSNFSIYLDPNNKILVYKNFNLGFEFGTDNAAPKNPFEFIIR